MSAMAAAANCSARSYKRPESVLVLVYTPDKRVLLLRRRRLKHFWQSVSGSLEWGETRGHAAVRELHEETGLDYHPVDCKTRCRFLIYPVWRYVYAPKVIENCEHQYRLLVSKPCTIRLDTSEHAEYGWFSAAEALFKAGSHTNRAAIRQWVLHEPPGLTVQSSRRDFLSTGAERLSGED